MLRLLFFAPVEVMMITSDRNKYNVLIIDSPVTVGFIVIHSKRRSIRRNNEEEDRGKDTGHQPGSNFNKIRRI